MRQNSEDDVMVLACETVRFAAVVVVVVVVVVVGVVGVVGVVCVVWYGFGMVSAWFWHGSAWFCNGFAMVLALFCDGLQWFLHASAMDFA